MNKILFTGIITTVFLAGFAIGQAATWGDKVKKVGDRIKDVGI